MVTNRTLAGYELIWWSRQRCGKGEEVHSVLKSDLAGGRLPSGLFGANAAWWAISVLAFNLVSWFYMVQGVIPQGVTDRFIPGPKDRSSAGSSRPTVSEPEQLSGPNESELSKVGPEPEESE